MATLCQRLQDLLDGQTVSYQTIHHTPDYTAQEAAAHTHTPGREFAKTVFIEVDGRDAMAVLPADHRINLETLRVALAAQSIRLTDEKRTKELCPDCDLGAAPPFGNLYNIPVYVAKVLADDEEITFNAGTHEDAIRMRFRDYADLAHPLVLEFTAGPH